MVLTHGANSLPRGPKLLYALDVDAFDINTLNDRGVQWDTAGKRKVDLSKVNGNLKLQFTYGSLQRLRLQGSEIGVKDSKNYRVELECPLIGYESATLSFGPYPQAFSYGYANLCGFWCSNTDEVVIYNNNYHLNSNYNDKLVVNRPKTLPWRTAWEYILENGERYIYCYIDNVLICKVKRNALLDTNFNIDYNGNSYNQSVQISKFRVFEI